MVIPHTHTFELRGSCTCTGLLCLCVSLLATRLDDWLRLETTTTKTSGAALSLCFPSPRSKLKGTDFVIRDPVKIKVVFVKVTLTCLAVPEQRQSFWNPTWVWFLLGSRCGSVRAHRRTNGSGVNRWASVMTAWSSFRIATRSYVINPINLRYLEATWHDHANHTPLGGGCCCWEGWQIRINSTFKGRGMGRCCLATGNPWLDLTGMKRIESDQRHWHCGHAMCLSSFLDKTPPLHSAVHYKKPLSKTLLTS